VSATQPPSRGLPKPDTESLTARAAGGLRQLFRGYGVVASLLSAMSIIAVLVRWRTIDWPNALQGALLDYERLVHLVFGLVIPSHWPSWSVDLVSAYFWTGVAVYVAGFSRWGPEAPSSWYSKLGWNLLDVVASLLWPLTLLIVALAGTLFLIAFAQALAALMELGAALLCAFQQRDRSELPIMTIDSPSSYLRRVTRFVFGTVAWELCRTLIFASIILASSAIIQAATSNLPSVSTP
jgi:hypothetical protein